MARLTNILNSQQAPQTLIMMSGEQLKQLIDDVTANTRRIVEEQYQPRYYTVEEMAQLFKCQVSTIYNWMSRGKIKAYKMEEGGRTYFDQAEVRDAMQRGLIGKYIHK